MTRNPRNRPPRPPGPAGWLEAAHTVEAVESFRELVEDSVKAVLTHHIMRYAGSNEAKEGFAERLDGLLEPVRVTFDLDRGLNVMQVTFHLMNDFEGQQLNHSLVTALRPAMRAANIPALLTQDPRNHAVSFVVHDITALEDVTNNLLKGINSQARVAYSDSGRGR